MEAEISPYAPLETDLVERRETDTEFFTVGPLKYSLMSVTTFGMYDVWWFYRNWHVFMSRDRSVISPVLRAVFTPLWIFAFGSRLVRDATGVGISVRLPVVALGILYFGFNALGHLPDPYWLPSLFSFVIVLPFEFAARRIAGGGMPARPTHGRLTRWNITWIVAVATSWVLVVAEILFPGEMNQPPVV